MTDETRAQRRARIRGNIDNAKTKVIEMKAQVEHSAVGRAALAPVFMLTDVLELVLDIDERLEEVETEQRRHYKPEHDNRRCPLCKA